MADRGRGDRYRSLGEDEVQDRQVVDRQIPDHVDVVLQQAEVHAGRIVVGDVAELAGDPQVADRADSIVL
jgi:hypothetical protein